MRPEQVLAYALRPSSASPAVGYLPLHNEQQKELVDAAFAPFSVNVVTAIEQPPQRTERPARAAART